MESPHMYENSQTETNKKAINNNNSNTNNNNIKLNVANIKHIQNSLYANQHGELTDLNSPEISLDLQNLIDDSQFNEGIFTEILEQSGKNVPVQNHHLNGLRQGQVAAGAVGGYGNRALAYMPQPVHSAASYQNNSDNSSNSSSSSLPSIKEEPSDPQVSPETINLWSFIICVLLQCTSFYQFLLA